jgi:hypothetical protein
LFVVFDRAFDAQVIAEAFEQGALPAAGLGKLDYGLEEVLEQLVTAQAVLV